MDWNYLKKMNKKTRTICEKLLDMIEEEMEFYRQKVDNYPEWESGWNCCLDRLIETIDELKDED